MPELPEVETVVRTLEQQIKNQEIKNVIIRYPKMIEGDSVEFAQRLKNEHFRKFERRGKYLIFRMDTVCLVVHLRMEGKFYLQDTNAPMSKHIHVIFGLQDKELRYCDTRKFGRMALYPVDKDYTDFHNLGPEPFWDSFNAEYIHQWRKGKKLPLKSMLLDQSFVAGVGNIYADEILAACHLRPGRSCKRITKKDEQHIVTETRRILSAAIQAGGTTIRTYTSSLGVTGRFQLSCIVHAQKECGICHGSTKVKYIGGRSSWYCPRCQH